MREILLSLCIVSLLTGCSSDPLNTADEHEQYAAVRHYEQQHGLYDWRTAPQVT